MTRTLRHARTAAAHSRTGHAARTVVAASAAAVLVAGAAISIAPAAQAVAALPCLGQTFTANGFCTVAAGDTVAFTIQGGPGGFGGSGFDGLGGAGGTGGAGGMGAKVAGVFTNTSGSEITVTVGVGDPGYAGADGVVSNPDGGSGTPGGSSLLTIDSSVFVEVSGGEGGTGGIGDGGANGNDGDPGMLVAPDPLPAGWSLIDPPPAGPGKVVFSAYVAPSTDVAASGPADLVQQVEVPASGSCADVKDADLKWGTTLTGGWHKAWGEWANRFVCTRTFHYGSNGWEITA